MGNRNVYNVVKKGMFFSVRIASALFHHTAHINVTSLQKKCTTEMSVFTSLVEDKREREKIHTTSTAVDVFNG